MSEKRMIYVLYIVYICTAYINVLLNDLSVVWYSTVYILSMTTSSSQSHHFKSACLRTPPGHLSTIFSGGREGGHQHLYLNTYFALYQLYTVFLSKKKKIPQHILLRIYTILQCCVQMNKSFNRFGSLQSRHVQHLVNTQQEEWHVHSICDMSPFMLC